MALGAFVRRHLSLIANWTRVSSVNVVRDRHPVVGPLLCERPALWSNLKESILYFCSNSFLVDTNHL